MKTYKVLLLALVVMVAALLSCKEEEDDGFGLPGEPGAWDLENFRSQPVTNEAQAQDLLGYLMNDNFWDYLGEADENAYKTVRDIKYPHGSSDNNWLNNSAELSLDYDGKSYSGSNGLSGASEASVTAKFSGWERDAMSSSDSLTSSVFLWSHYYYTGKEGEWLDRSKSYGKTISEISGSYPYTDSHGTSLRCTIAGKIDVTEYSYTKKTLTRVGFRNPEPYEGSTGERIRTEGNSSCTISMGFTVDNGVKGAKFIITYASESSSSNEKTRAVSNYSNALLSDIIVYGNSGNEICRLKNLDLSYDRSDDGFRPENITGVVGGRLQVDSYYWW